SDGASDTMDTWHINWPPMPLMATTFHSIASEHVVHRTSRPLRSVDISVALETGFTWLLVYFCHLHSTRSLFVPFSDLFCLLAFRSTATQQYRSMLWPR